MILKLFFPSGIRGAPGVVKSKISGALSDSMNMWHEAQYVLANCSPDGGLRLKPVISSATKSATGVKYL